MFNFKKKENNKGDYLDPKNKKQNNITDIIKLSKKIEAILFYKAEEVSISFLVKFLGIKKDEIIVALNELKKNLKNNSFDLIINNEKLILVIKKEYSKTISELKGEEKSGELSSSALETLSIVLYKGPISKSQIDQIRGVNSSYILRNLLVRGLIERKIQSGKTVYIQTVDLMRFLGVNQKEDLPAYNKVIETLNKIDFEEQEDIFSKNNSEIK